MKFIFHQKMKLLPGMTHDWIYTEVQLTPDRKSVVGFVVLLIYQHAETTHEIVKHDCAHGKYHVHRYYEGPYSKVIESDEPISNELFQRVKAEVHANAIAYRERFMQRYHKNQ